MRARSVVRSVSLVVVTALLVANGGLPARVRRAEAAGGEPYDVLTQGLDDWFGFLGGAADIGALAEAVPSLTVTPGGEDGIGLASFYALWRASQLGDWAGVGSLDDVVDTLDGADGDIGDGRTVSVTATGDTGGSTPTVTVELTLARTVTAGLSLHSSEPVFDFSAAGGVPVTLAATLAFTAGYDAGSELFFLEHGPASPALTVAVGVDGISDPSAVQAGVGILGVQLGDATTFDLDVELAVSIEDPDGDGRLAFAKLDPGGNEVGGELAAEGAAAGLLDVSLGGTLDASLVIEARPSSQIANLPQFAAATVQASSSDLSSEPISVSYATGALDPLEAFQTLTPGDLADALGQLAVFVRAALRADDTSLPFMSGRLADAILAEEALIAFLDEHVEALGEDGHLGEVTVPTFASVQDLVAQLEAATGLPGGASFDVSGGTYDTSVPGAPALALTLGISRDTGTPQLLNAASELLAGGGGTVTYGGQTLVDSSKSFLDSAADLAGRQVVAGTSSALIEGVLDQHTLQLSATPFGSPTPTSLWQGGTPANGTAYSISGLDPLLGRAEFGDALEDATGIAIANDSVSLATVRPSYGVTLPLVLDLRPPDTSNCNPDAGPATPCPATVTNPDGTATIITATPTPAQRIRLRTGETLLFADAPIEAPASFTTSVGFLAVEVTGTVRACTQGAPADCDGPAPDGQHLLTVGLAGPAEDVSVQELFRRLQDDPAGTVDVSVAGQAWAGISLSVPGNNAFFGGDPSASVVLTMPDITDPASVTHSADVPSLTAFGFDPDDPLSLLVPLLAALQQVSSTVGELPGGADLHQKLPLLGRSVADLVGAVEQGGPGTTYGASSLTDSSKDFAGYEGRRVVVGTQVGVVASVSNSNRTLNLVSPWGTQPAGGTPYQIGTGLTAAIDALSAAPPDTLQELLDMLVGRLGSGSTTAFDVDTTASPPTLRLSVDWQREAFTTRVPLSFDFDLGGTDRSLVGTEGTGSLAITTSGEVQVSLLVPLSTAAVGDPLAHLKVDPEASSVSAHAGVIAEDVSIGANLGPLALSLGDPGADPTGTELRADIGVQLANTTDSGPVSLSQFASNLAVSFDNGAVDCDGVEGGSSPLAVCASFPTFFRLGGAWQPVSSDAATNAFVVRLPQNPTDVDDFVDLTATVGGEPRFETPDPSAVQDLFDSMLLDLSTLGDGLLSYLQLLDVALTLANAGGRLPVVGEDLQQGADFLGEVRSTIDTALDPDEARKFASAGPLKDYLEDNLDGLPGSIDVALSCSATLAPATITGHSTAQPDEIPDDTPTDITYQYRVVAHRNDGTGDTVPSNIRTVVNGPLQDAGFSNTITWSHSEFATHYRILRRIGNSGSFVRIGPALIARNAAGSQSFTDTTSTEASGTPYTAVTQQPALVDCPGEHIDGVSLTLDLGQGTVDPDDGCSSGCIARGVPLDIGIPGLSLSAAPGSGQNEVQAEVAWSLHLKAELSRTHGFRVFTQDDRGDGKARPELFVGASFDLPEEMQARLAFIDIDVSKRNGDTKLFAGEFAIDLHRPGGTVCDGECTPSSAALTLADLKAVSSPGSVVTPALTATADIDWLLRASADSMLPGIQTEFRLLWVWDDPADVLDPDNLEELAFNNVAINAGEFLGSALGPIFQQVADLFEPLQPVTDSITAPIPVLSELSRAVGGGDVSLLTLAKAYSTVSGGDQSFEDFVEVFARVIGVAGALSSGGGCEDACVTVGSFDVRKDLALSTTNTPQVAQSLVDPKDESSTSPIEQLDGETAADLTGTGTGGAPGFSFPALEQPTEIFGLLMGKDVTLAKFDSGTMRLGFTFSQTFGPVYAPPPVMVVISGSASVSARIVAGFDTYGLRRAAEQGLTFEDLPDAAPILESLFFQTVDSSGKPIPVIELTGSIGAGAQVTAIVVSIEVLGGITLTIAFTWRDPNNDGKFRLTEFLSSVFNNPVCLFNVGGRLSVFLKVIGKIGVCPFCVKLSFTVVDATIASFDIQPDCEPAPPELAGKDDDVLYLFAGKLGTQALRGDGWDNGGDKDEAFLVRQDEAGDLTVYALGFTDTFSGIATVVLDGRGHAGSIEVSFLGKEEGDLFTKTVVVVGGDGDDHVRTGTGASYVDGRAGDDVITTADRIDLLVSPASAPRAVVAGGPGADTITTGNARNWVAGDAALTFAETTASFDGGGSATTIDPATVDHPETPTEAVGDGDDTVGVGLGASEVWGGGGADAIAVAPDNPQADLAANAGQQHLFRSEGVTVVGGSGGDGIAGGSGDDVIYTGRFKTQPGANGLGSEDAVTPESPANVVDTGTGDDQVFGSRAVDLVTSHSRSDEAAELYGGGEDDVLIGGDGADRLYGGPGDDHLVAEPSTVGAVGSAPDVLGSGGRKVTRLPNANDPSEKYLVGGGGSDRIHGGDGGATIYGDQEVDDCFAGDPVASDPPPENPTISDPPDPAIDDAADLVFGGAGVDVVNAGGGDDHVYAKGGDDLVCGNAGNDVLDGGAHDDQVWGGTGNDTVYGGTGADALFGNDGNDTIHGGSGADVAEGNDGSDNLFGGPGADTLVGGTRAPGRPDQGDAIWGGDHKDLLLGDNGVPAEGDSPALKRAGEPFDLDGSDPAAGGPDLLFGGADNDAGYGGLDEDVILGGAGNDYLEGNNASDRIYGEGGDDVIIGGSSQVASGTGQGRVGRPDAGDWLYGGPGQDLIAGDNAIVTDAPPGAGSPITRQRLALERVVDLLDLGPSPTAGTSGGDYVEGGGDTDVILGQGGDDRLRAGDGDDYAEGGPGVDWIEGNDGDDDLVGGSSTIQGADTGATTRGQPDAGDVIFGGAGDDLVAGDNAIVTRVAPFDFRTFRVGSSGAITARRAVRLLDLSDSPGDLLTPAAGRSGADYLSGGSDVDVLLGQDGDDRISGGRDDDYAEGNGGADHLFGDRTLAEAAVTLPAAAWPGDPGSGAELEGDLSRPHGQDDLMGGSSSAGFRDAGDVLYGDGGADYLLGDNGTIVRDVRDANGDPVSDGGPAGVAPLHDRVYELRYPSPPPAGAAYVRKAGPGEVATRYCAVRAEGTCEQPGAYGDDLMFGGDGDDTLYGQDGDDELHGEGDDDDLYGELGDDVIFGGDGDDAMVGDRGGIVRRYETGGRTFTVSHNQVPRLSFTGFIAGTVTPQTDLRHDVDGDAFVGSATAPAMPYDGVDFGGDDRMRGGNGRDAMHGAAGDDLMNGDAGGDTLFGGNGADVLWGGRGSPDPATPNERGDNDFLVDYLFGGRGATSGPSLDPDTGVLGADVMDWRPRGSYPGDCAAGPWPGVNLTGDAVDPCAWFEMTDTHDGDAATNQHHHGIDWMYGGWDRDVMQANVAEPGPNDGDRLLDWTGAYNLYTHCTPDYGGFNDVRQRSPSMLRFLERWASALGAGQTPDDVTTAGTSAFVEVAIAYQGDQAHSAGRAFPDTPGHFFDVACEP